LYKVCVEEFNAYFGKRVFRIYIITLFLLNVCILLWKAREILKGICIYVNIFLTFNFVSILEFMTTYYAIRVLVALYSCQCTWKRRPCQWRRSSK